jgi:hypothetical protein
MRVPRERPGYYRMLPGSRNSVSSWSGRAAYCNTADLTRLSRLGLPSQPSVRAATYQRPETPGANTASRPPRTERRRARSGVLRRAQVLHVRASSRLAARIFRQPRRRAGPRRLCLDCRPPSRPPNPTPTVRDGRTAVARLRGLRVVDLPGAHTTARFFSARAIRTRRRRRSLGLP